MRWPRFIAGLRASEIVRYAGRPEAWLSLLTPPDTCTISLSLCVPQFSLAQPRLSSPTRVQTTHIPPPNPNRPKATRPTEPPSHPFVAARSNPAHDLPQSRAPSPPPPAAYAPRARISA
nr:hypothetical protein GCM10025732_35990 [Glycomyces mayteni]